jgi:hypothetical protein
VRPWGGAGPGGGKGGTHRSTSSSIPPSLKRLRQACSADEEEISKSWKADSDGE